jgi:hypothetical protein
MKSLGTIALEGARQGERAPGCLMMVSISGSYIHMTAKKYQRLNHAKILFDDGFYLG